MIIWVIFLILMTRMKKKLELLLFFEIVSKNTVHYFSNGECTQKKRVVFLKPCLQSIKIQKTIK